MRNLFIILGVALLCSGCATTRKNAGKPMVAAGQWVGKNGMVVMVVGAFNPLTWILVPVGVSTMAVALPIYYGGCLISWEKPEREPFNM